MYKSRIDCASSQTWGQVENGLLPLNRNRLAADRQSRASQLCLNKIHQLVIPRRCALKTLRDSGVNSADTARSRCSSVYQEGPYSSSSENNSSKTAFGVTAPFSRPLRLRFTSIGLSVASKLTVRLLPISSLHVSCGSSAWCRVLVAACKSLFNTPPDNLTHLGIGSRKNM